MTAEKSPKEIGRNLARFARDQKNKWVGILQMIAEADELSTDITRAAAFLEKLDEKTKLDHQLDSSIAAKEVELKKLETRAADLLASYKPSMVELDKREKVIASREAEVAAREQRVTQREEKARQIAGHLASFGESDS
jgi:uncharacterized protein (DUF3084 family)